MGVVSAEDILVRRKKRDWLSGCQLSVEASEAGDSRCFKTEKRHRKRITNVDVIETLLAVRVR